MNANQREIPVAAPSLVGNEKEYVLDCLNSTWISSKGEYVDQFESEFSKFCNSEYAISCTNGTSALELALEGIGIGPGDEVIVPTLTFVASANAVKYCGAEPVFADVTADTWNIDVDDIKEKITPNTEAILVVHLYGHPVDMDPVLEIAEEYDLYVVEDSAEAHGAQYKSEPVGSIGDVGTFSFYGNKILTTGEGGMVVTDDEQIAEQVTQLKTQGVDPDRRYWFPKIGYNRRMTNVQAAIGLGQLEKADWHIQQRLRVAEQYDQMLKNLEGVARPVEKDWAKNAFWMYSLVLDENAPINRDQLRKYLNEKGIETRPFFYPMHILPPYKHHGSKEDFPVATSVSKRGINLPTWSGLSREQISYIAETVRSAVESS
jgi:perosamine synthetase